MGEFDAKSLGLVDSFMRHHLFRTVFLTWEFFFLRTPIDGQFGWGGTGLKWYQARPKVDSGGTEIHRRV